ncbi:MAG: 5-formyltetrahydrofolate cyclo-ligase [Nocardioidaceae bacterium]
MSRPQSGASGQSAGSHEDRGATKQALRSATLAARELLTTEMRALAAVAVRDRVCALPLLDDRIAAVAGSASLVAAYVSTGTEPGTEPLIDALHDRGVKVILPVLRDDLDLDWAGYEPGAWRRGRFGLIEPAGPALGRGAVQAADLVVCPGLAADRSGHRLGRGGGSYDRVLFRLTAHTTTCLLLYDGELLESVPAQPHDQPVDFVITPTQTLAGARESS